MVEPEREAPGRSAATTCPAPTITASTQLTPLARGAAFDESFHREDDEAADEGGPRDGGQGLGELELELHLQDEDQHAGDDEGEEDLDDIVAGVLIAEMGDERDELAPVDKDDGQNGPGLDHDVEDVRFLRAQPVLGDEKVARGGDGEKFGYAFNDAEKDDLQVVKDVHRDGLAALPRNENDKCGGRTLQGVKGSGTHVLKY